MTGFETFREMQQDCTWCTPFQGVLYFQNDIWLSTTFPSTIFTKLAEAQHLYVQLSYAEFHPNRIQRWTEYIDIYLRP